MSRGVDTRTHPTSSNLDPSSSLPPTHCTLQHEQSPPHPPHFLAVALETAGAPQHDVQCQQTDALKGLHHLALGHCRPLVLKHEPTPHKHLYLTALTFLDHFLNTQCTNGA